MAKVFQVELDGKPHLTDESKKEIKLFDMPGLNRMQAAKKPSQRI